LSPSCAPTALIVDDEAALRAALERVLTQEGFEVLAAENGAVALSLAAANPPDVIVLDSEMPVLDGIGFARSYRRSTPRLAPIIATSGRHDAALFAALVGAAAYLRKPFAIEELLATARRLVDVQAPDT
jgi:two-component system, OmpR family, response regulator MprA